ncbi:helix-turn-helix transcriptional regulator [Deinococcus aetherius]|nr:helix-turn-helix transcriptional regulator [Deinococcus aetherius]
MTRLSEQATVALTAALYWAATDPHLFPAFVEALCAHHGASKAYLHHVVKQPGLSWYESSRQGIDAPGESFSIGVNHPRETQREYMARWVDQDGFTNAILARGLTQGPLVFDRRETCPDAEFERSAFHHEFARHHELFHLIGGAGFSLDSPAGFFVLIGRPRSLGAFPAWDVQALSLLLPHLGRAQAIHRQLWNLRRERDTRALALDTLDRPCLAVDAALRVEWMNIAAEGLLRGPGGLSVKGGQVRAEVAWQHEQLREAVRRTALLGRGISAQAGSTLAITRPAPAGPLRVTVMPLPGAGEDCMGVLLWLEDPDQVRPMPLEVLRQRYGLTAAEARVAVRLSQGDSVEEIAAGSQVSLGTVRNQLKQVFAKTDTHRQAQVVQLVLSLAAALPDRR